MNERIRELAYEAEDYADTIVDQGGECCKDIGVIKMTKLIAYHPKTNELALFETDGQYWIGSYSSHMTHQNGEPPYGWIRGDWNNQEEGLSHLSKLTGEEF